MPVGCAWGGARLENPQCTADGQGREPGWGLQGINVERSLQGLSPGLSKPRRGGVKGGSERGGGGEGAGRPVKKLQEGGGTG